MTRQPVPLFPLVIAAVLLAAMVRDVRPVALLALPP